MTVSTTTKQYVASAIMLTLALAGVIWWHVQALLPLTPPNDAVVREHGNVSDR